MKKIRITEEQARMLENLNKHKVIKITESQYRTLIESLSEVDINKQFDKAMPSELRPEFFANRKSLSKGMNESLWESFVSELYNINESSEKMYESLIKIMEACGYVENRKLSKIKFEGNKEMAKNVILGGLQTLHETGSPFMAMESMENEFQKQKQSIKQQLTQRRGEKPTPEEITAKLADIRANELRGRAERGEPLNVKASGEIKEIDGEEETPTKMVPMDSENEDEVDTITMDVPLFIRALEYSREDAQNDLDLHTIAQNAVSLSKEYGMLNMDNYGDIFGDAEDVEPQAEPQSPELNELESEDAPKQYTCKGPQRIVGLDILNYEPFKSLPEKRIDVVSMGKSTVSLPHISEGGRNEVIFAKEDLFDSTSVHFGKEYESSGYIDNFKRKYGEEPIFCDIVMNDDRNIANAKIVNLPKLDSFDPRGYGSLDEKEIDEVTSTTGALGTFSPINPIGYEPKKMETESKIYEALNALKKK